ncbi:phosphatidate phosphatase LPIN [Nematocida minor]|uniref:phosphatidate phosphatase LPIN n=1 Tax=Nematocida minor TaxID=1912983 RepID=UPI00221E7BE4|nr:phosphatidate phosphatase LPIN [Nematocida minor]KAI5191209.1 phosphatidate phosphatase LPIN [Nematocida minor]
MNFMGRVFNSMTDLYKDIHPGQISGANDVIVTRTSKGAYSTGFHARFGSVHSFKMSREVILIVNDRVISIEARLDREGNVFFGVNHSPHHTEHALISSPFKSFKMFIESENNYSFLLSNYERIYECILNRQYVFSECIYKQVVPNRIQEVFSEHKIKTFIGNDAVVIGLYEESSTEIVFFMTFCLFSELYFCVERRNAAGTGSASLGADSSLNGRERPENDVHEEQNQKYTEKFLIKQLLKKRVRPEQSPDRRKREVYLPEKYLDEMHLVPGPNKAVYRLSGTPIFLTCNIYLWDDFDKVVISDIDGTVTKSDLVGYIYGAMGKDWTHLGIAALYNKIVENGYKIVYLSSRPIGHIGLTKSYLERVEQNHRTLPNGPVILFPGRLLSAIYKEVVQGPEEFKISVISEIKGLLQNGRIHAGFGNKNSDRMAYEVCEIDPGRIFIVNTLSEISTGRNGIVKLTHSDLCDIAEGVFPPVRPLHQEVSQKYIGESWWSVRSPED